MRRTLLMIAAVALLLTQCRKPAVELPTAGPANENMVSMTVTVGHGRTLIDPDGAITWSAGDKLYVGDGSKYIGYLTLQGAGGDATGTFSGSVNTTTSTTFGFYYLGSGDYTSSLESDATTVDISFASQTGVLADASSCHIGYGTATGKVEGTNVVLDTNPVQMTSKVAIAYFEFKDGTPEGYSGAIELSGANICNSMTVGFNGSFSGTTDTEGNAISLESTSSSKKYVMLVPTGIGEETLNFGGDATGTTKFYKGIEANKFYCLGAGEPIAVTVKPLWVDLGLSVKWATCNLGATSPEDYGDYYVWGATTTWYQAGYAQESPQSHWKDGYSDGYAWVNCPYTSGTYSALNKAVFTKYVPQSQASTYGCDGYWDTKTVLDAEDDAARVVWGGDWRMPTEDEFTELIDNTTRNWRDPDASITIGEQTVSMPVAGYYCESIKSGFTGKYIFLPAAGNRQGSEFYQAGSYGYYGSSSLSSYSPEYACNLIFHSGIFNVSGSIRSMGFTVRPVCPPQN